MSLRAYLIVYYLDSLKWKYFIHFDISVKVEYTPNFTNYFVNLFTFYNSYVTIKTKTISLQNYFQMQINKNMGTFVSVLEVKNQILLLNIKKNN